ncbi:MAG: hypothetical protein AB1397_05330, partial [bacterium]
DDMGMPVYYYDMDTGSATLISDSNTFAQRTLYDKDVVSGETASTIGFNNKIFLKYQPRIFAELTDQDLYTEIREHKVGATSTYLSGIRLDNNTGIQLAVYTEDDDGATIGFSGAADLEHTSPSVFFELPTYYAFLGTVTPPAPSELIRASDLNSTTFSVPAFKNWRRYIASVVEVPFNVLPESNYANHFYITVQNNPL